MGGGHDIDAVVLELKYELNTRPSFTNIVVRSHCTARRRQGNYERLRPR